MPLTGLRRRRAGTSDGSRMLTSIEMCLTYPMDALICGSTSTNYDGQHFDDTRCNYTYLQYSVGTYRSA